MAEREKPMNPEREERRKGIYDNARSKTCSRRRPHGKPARTPGGREADKKPGAGGEGVLARHASEREGLRSAHEGERRDEHNRQRDEHRSMNARHEEEHGGVEDHHGLVALHRQHEHEKHRLRHEHHDRHHAMSHRHHAERHATNMRHEAEMLGAEGGNTEAGAGTAGETGTAAEAA